ncbi:MAG TPA: hypothetical protein VMS73_05770 [Anaerolineaceae bacterium]|nr:hypothetical protein [Anaerolineaceae bacterium]
MQKDRLASAKYLFLRSLILLLIGMVAACTVPLLNSNGVSQNRPVAPAKTAAVAGLHLNGSLILIDPTPDGNDIIRVELATGKISLIYHLPEHALLGSALVSPDRKQILLVYAPPPLPSKSLTYTSLYLLPIDGSSDPHLIIASDRASQAYFSPTWSPDGNAVYASHYNLPSSNSGVPGQYTIDRVTLDGKVQTILKDAEWPRISPDGSHIAFITAGQDYGSNNELYIADSNGVNPVPVLTPGSYPAVDDHFFTSDGETIVFSAVNKLAQAEPSFLDQLFGIEVASAHTVPSDWYSVSLGNRTVQRLTNLNDTGMYAALSPDGQHFAFTSQTGTYVMNLDGTNLIQIPDLVSIGTVDWIP